MSAIVVRSLLPETRRALRARAAELGPQHGGGLTTTILDDAVVRPATRVKCRSALAALAGPLGGLDLDITRDMTPAKPPMLE